MGGTRVMFSMTLELTKNCNLNCKYCYIGEKYNMNMSKETALKAIKIGIEEAKKHKDKTLEIDFYGGEPLLNFDLIKYCVEKSKELSKGKIKFRYIMTTNLTLMNKDIIEYLINEKFELKVSIDGNERVHDLNRVFYDGKGSYQEIISKLKYLEQYTNEVGLEIQVSNVITKNNYMNYFESFKHIVELGFNIIDTGIDYTVSWNKEEIDILKDQVEKTVDYVISEYKNGKYIGYLFLENSVKQNIDDIEFYPCKAGIVSNFISWNGEIYPCSEIDKRVCIGHVDSGIDFKKVKEITRICSINNEKCRACEITNRCACKSCLMQNLSINNSFDIPVEILCELRKFMYSLVNEKFDVDRIKKIAVFE